MKEENIARDTALIVIILFLVLYFGPREARDQFDFASCVAGAVIGVAGWVWMSWIPAWIGKEIRKKKKKNNKVRPIESAKLRREERRLKLVRKE